MKRQGCQLCSGLSRDDWQQFCRTYKVVIQTKGPVPLDLFVRLRRGEYGEYIIRGELLDSYIGRVWQTDDFPKVRRGVGRQKSSNTQSLYVWSPWKLFFLAFFFEFFVVVLCFGFRLFFFLACFSFFFVWVKPLSCLEDAIFQSYDAYISAYGRLLGWDGHSCTLQQGLGPGMLLPSYRVGVRTGDSVIYVFYFVDFTNPKTCAM